MTPEDFAKRMALIATLSLDDPERAHIEADSLIVEAFKETQFWEGIATYVKMRKWYS